MIRRYLSKLAIACIIILSTLFGPLGAEWGHLELQPLAFLPPSAEEFRSSGGGNYSDDVPPGWGRIAVFMRDDVPRRLGNSSAAKANSANRFAAWIDFFPNNQARNFTLQDGFINRFQFNKTLSANFLVRCHLRSTNGRDVYIEERRITDGENRNATLFEWAPQTFDITFPGSCRFKFQLDTICTGNRVGTSCDTFGPRTAKFQLLQGVSSSLDEIHLCVERGKKGYMGHACNQDVNECEIYAPDVFPECKNGAQCRNKLGTYKCHCPDNFTGTYCEEDVDECEVKHPCKNNGTCYNYVGFFECACTIAYKGKTCEDDVDECKQSVCQDFATCINTHGSFRCICPHGYSGTYCQEIDVCVLYNPCSKNSICEYKNRQVTCLCNTGYHGTYCEYSPEEKEDEVSIMEGPQVLVLLATILSLFFGYCLFLIGKPHVSLTKTMTDTEPETVTKFSKKLFKTFETQNTKTDATELGFTGELKTDTMMENESQISQTLTEATTTTDYSCAMDISTDDKKGQAK